MSRKNKNLSHRLFKDRKRLDDQQAYQKKRQDTDKKYCAESASREAQKRAEEKRHRLYRASEAAKAQHSF